MFMYIRYDVQCVARANVAFRTTKSESTSEWIEWVVARFIRNKFIRVTGNCERRSSF